MSISSWPTPTVSISTILLARGIQHQSDIARGARQAAQKSARRHGTNEDARVAGMSLHANAIAQDRAARVRTRRIEQHQLNQ